MVFLAGDRQCILLTKPDTGTRNGIVARIGVVDKSSGFALDFRSVI